MHRPIDTISRASWRGRRTRSGASSLTLVPANGSWSPRRKSTGTRPIIAPERLDPFDGFFRSHGPPPMPPDGLLDLPAVRRWFALLSWGDEEGLYTYQMPLEGRTGSRVSVLGRSRLMLSCYDYLGLAGHPAVEDAAIAAVRTYGTGTGGVRMLTGTTALHRDLEREIAAFEANAVDVWTGSLSKAVPSNGGFLAGRRDLIVYLQHASAPFWFSAALGPAAAGAALESLRVVRREPKRLEALRRNADALRVGLRARGYDTGNSQSAIVPVLVGEDVAAWQLARRLFDEGVLVSAVVYPAVRRGAARLRLCATAAQSAADLDEALDAFDRAGRQAGIT